MINRIGTCGNCGGDVEIPSMYCGYHPGSCNRCGARPKVRDEIEMEKPQPKFIGTFGIGEEHGPTCSKALNEQLRKYR